MFKFVLPATLAILGFVLIALAVSDVSQAQQSYVLRVPMVAADSASGDFLATPTKSATLTSTSTPTKTVGSVTSTSTLSPTGVSSSATPTRTNTATLSGTPVSLTPTSTTVSTGTPFPTPINTAVPTATPTSTPTNTAVPTTTPTSTPTTNGCSFAALPDVMTYFGSASSYPRIVQIDFTNFDAEVGESQTITVKVWGDAPIESVSVVLGTDHGLSSPKPLTSVSQALIGGVYKDQWSINYSVVDTHDCVYTFDFVVVQLGGGTISPTLTVR